MNALLHERYGDRIAGVLTCKDRIVKTGTTPGACYADGMTSFLNAKHIRIFDYPHFAEPLCERICKEDVVVAVTSRAVTIQGWCTSFRRWKPAPPTGPGITRRLARAT